MQKHNFKIGDLAYYQDDDRDSEFFIIEFYGTGAESAKLYPNYSDYRRTTDFVVMWDLHDEELGYSWVPADIVYKATKLHKAMK